MIAQKFDYYKPETWQEAFDCMQSLKEQGVKADYYSGGTEVTTNLRKGALKTGALIDLKGIPEMNTITLGEESIRIGANATLNMLIEKKALSFLKPVVDQIADHSVRNALTIGGNICGRLPYREAVLPLLALNAKLRWVDANGLSEHFVREVFDKRLKLPANGFLYELIVPLENTSKLKSKREVQVTDVDYPTVHTVIYETETEVFMGLSGFASFPVYEVVERSGKSREALMETLIEGVEKFAKEDDRASKEYRMHLLNVHLKSMLGGQS